VTISVFRAGEASDLLPWKKPCMRSHLLGAASVVAWDLGKLSSPLWCRRPFFPEFSACWLSSVWTGSSLRSIDQPGAKYIKSCPTTSQTLQDRKLHLGTPHYFTRSFCKGKQDAYCSTPQCRMGIWNRPRSGGGVRVWHGKSSPAPGSYGLH
jgi:hypothetical protein